MQLSDILDASDISDYINSHENITENALFLGSFGYALAKYNGTNEYFFTTAHHGRFDRRLSKTFGMFVRTLPLGYSFNENTATEKFLEDVCNDYYILKSNDSIPFGELVSQYGANMDV